MTDAKFLSGSVLKYSGEGRALFRHPAELVIHHAAAAEPALVSAP